MRVHVAKHTLEMVRESKKTLCVKDLAYPLDALEAQADLLKEAWGRPELFVEVLFTPRPDEYHTQYDLLLCFRDRIAHIEMKRRDQTRGRELQKTRNQVAGQRIGLKRRAHAAGWDANAVISVLFVPEAETDDIAELEAALEATQDGHILVAGVHRDPTFLATQCFRALTALKIRPGPPSGHLANVVIRAIDHELWKPSFASVAAARETVCAAPSDLPDELPADSWHIAALRAPEVAHGAQIIRRHGVLEVIGAPGSGKSAYVRDLATYLNKSRYREVLDYWVREAQTSDDVLRTLWLDLTGEHASLGTEALLARLVRKSFICWVRGYDEASANALNETVRRARAHHTAAGKEAEAYWVFESVTQALGDDAVTLRLRPLDASELFEILQRVGRPGVPGRDPNDVVAQSNGLPGLAMRTWQSRGKVPAAHASSTHGVFEDQLEDIEKDALPLIALAAAHAPLETSHSLLAHWLDAALPTLGFDRARALVTAVLTKLEPWGIVRVDAPPERSLELLLGGQPTRSATPAFVVWQDIGFLEHVLGRATAAWHEDRLETLREHLLSRLGSGSTLPEVTVALLLGEIGPFMWSSFRHTHWHPCLRWMYSSRGRRLKRDEEQAAFLRMLDLLSQLSAPGATQVRQPSNVVDGIATPTPGTARMLAIVRARVRAGLREDARTLHRWRAENDEEADADIRVETLVRIASAYQLAGFPRLSFDALFSGYDQRKEVGSATRGLVLYSVLATVNRRQLLGLGGAIGRNVDGLIAEAATELANLAIADENVVSLANALFYRCRGVIQVKAGSAPRESLDHLPTLAFVEHVAPMRRLQALLTQASVSRYVCSNGSTGWAEYRERAKHAVVCLRRAQLSARHRLSSSHLLNASSYALEVLACGLRYSSEPEARSELPQLGEIAAKMTEETVEALRGLRMLPGDELMIMSHVRLMYPLAVVLRECRYSDWAADAKNRLHEPLENMLSAFKEMVQDRSRRGDAASRKAVQAYLDLTRCLRALGAMRHANSAGVLAALCAMGETVTEGRNQSERLTALAGELIGATRPSAVA